MAVLRHSEAEETTPSVEKLPEKSSLEKEPVVEKPIEKPKSKPRLAINFANAKK